MDVLRTPDERFEHLPGFNFDPHYITEIPGYPGIRTHYLDEGGTDAAEVFLACMANRRGVSYRKMIPVFSRNGIRSVAPDLIDLAVPTSQR